MGTPDETESSTGIPHASELDRLIDSADYMGITIASRAPAVSVLISNYNHGKYLRQSLAGVLRQTLTDFEVVLTDDGSTDGSQEIIAELAAKDARIRPTYFKQNRGAMAATINNMSRARGRLIYGGAADDFILEKRFFEFAVDALRRHPEAAGFYGIAGLLSSETNKLVGSMGSSPVEGFVDPAVFFKAFLRGEAFVPGNSSIWRRDAMEECGGFDYSLGPQVDFWVNHALPIRRGVVYARAAFTCQRIYEDNTNYGSKGSLWEVAARFATVENRFREIAPSYEGMERDWKLWRARWMLDAIEKTGVRL